MMPRGGLRLQPAAANAPRAWLSSMRSGLAVFPIAIALARSYRAQSLGDDAAAIDHARQALELIPEGDHFNHAQVAALLGTAYWRAGDLARAAQGFTECQASFARAGNLVFAATSPLALAYLREAEGRLCEAADIYRQALQYALEHGEAMAPAMPSLHLGLGLVLWSRANSKPAQSICRKARP